MPAAPAATAAQIVRMGLIIMLFYSPRADTGPLTGNDGRSRRIQDKSGRGAPHPHFVMFLQSVARKPQRPENPALGCSAVLRWGFLTNAKLCLR
jgi:hypothetical protein